MRTNRRSIVIVSVGYERRSLQELIEELRSRGVQLLVDVRELPLSRRKGFSKTALGISLEAVGIGYMHVRIAGNPYRKAFHEDPSECLRQYGLHLDNNPGIMADVASRIKARRVAFLCYERAHQDCHRSILSARMVSNGACREIVAIE